MSTFPTGTETPFARAVSAEVRAVLAARRMNLRELAKGAGFKSHNYVAIRLRDEKPFTLDDIERIVAFLEGDSTEAWEFIKRADQAHSERLWIEASDAVSTVEPVVSLADEDHITWENLSRLLGAAEGAPKPGDKLVLFVAGLGATGSADWRRRVREAAEDEALFTDEDWRQLEDLANGYVGKSTKELTRAVDIWWETRGAVGAIELKGYAGGRKKGAEASIELSGDQAAGEAVISGEKGTGKSAWEKRTEHRERIRREMSEFSDAEAARDEDREKDTLK